MASGDIRKWFMKQPAKSTPAATPASNDTSKGGEKNGTTGRYNSTSKFFPSSSPASQDKDRKEESKPLSVKASAGSSKRFKGVDSGSEDDEFDKPPTKKIRNVEVSDEDRKSVV